MSNVLSIRGAREHNLCGLDVDIPRDRLVVVTGVSGSGKSSLAFDTIFREGQRRYVESLSSYARQFIGQMRKPDVDRVEGLGPAICIDQKTVNRNPRSTVGTTTEILDFLRLLYARLGTARCPSCGEPIESRTASQIAHRLVMDHPGQRCLVLAPVVRGRKGEYRAEQEEWQREGFRQALIDGRLHDLSTPAALARYENHDLAPVLDRLVLDERSLPRLREAVDRSLPRSNGAVAVLIGPESFDGQGEWRILSSTRACPSGHIELPELEPRCFSFNHPMGMCPDCRGLGELRRFGDHLLVPDPERSLAERALRALTEKGTLMFSDWGPRELKAIARQNRFSLATPWRDLTPEARHAVLHEGVPEAGIRGAVPVLQELWDQWHIPLLERFMERGRCPGCAGTRLGPVARAVTFRGHPIDSLTGMSLSGLAEFLRSVEPNPFEARVGREIFRELRARLGFLEAVGLGYLSLDRSASTLSGGEAQRIRLASQVGTGLQGVLYVLDEPSIGLHPRDNRRLLDTLTRLRDQGNSVLVVEHDEETIREADHVLDIGPGAGSLGGKLIGQGPATRLESVPESLTGQYLSGARRVPLPAGWRPCGPDVPRLVARGCREHNLGAIDFAIPLGRLVALTGPSGSGKSTILDHILAPALLNLLHGAERHVGAFDGLDGAQHLDRVIEIDQTPIGRTPRSNPATYTGVFDEIRRLFSTLPEARARGYGPGRFSFNVRGGRCDECEGSGTRIFEMQLMSDIEIPCPECQGRRFNAPTLEVHFRGRTIADVLAMSVEDALQFFEAHPRIVRGLSMLSRIGLGYIRLGQPSTTLSGGEAQRIKLATELQKPARGRTLYLLDEPTTGLHFQDVERLLDCLQRLVDLGNSVLVVEHNLVLVRAADWVVDLGPEGGAGGGRILAEGPPEYVAASLDSPTGPWLARSLDSARRPPVISSDSPQFPPAPPSGPRSMDLDIRVRGASKHNLRNLNVRIPRHRLVAITGPSGSGKTSLAFDTLFSEGQRRFVESLSTYARRFLGRMDRAEADAVEGLAPAIAIDQKSSVRSPRSTVATLTEIHDWLRVLWARGGTAHDPKTGEVLRGHGPASMADSVLAAAPGALVSVWAPAHIPGSGLPLFLQGSSALPRVASQLLELGFEIARVRNEELELRDCPELPDDIHVDLRADRVLARPRDRKRLMEAILKARRHAHGMVRFRWDGGELLLGEHPVNPATGYFQKEAWEPRHFSFNSHFGACPACEGMGTSGRGLCPSCGGERLRPETRAVRVGGLRLPEFLGLTVFEALAFCRSLQPAAEVQAVVQPVLRELTGRLAFLVDVGVGYLALDRGGHTLSGGEAQRIRLASQIGSGLEGVLYVLDEPTTGLHQRDTAQLVTTLRRLRDLGNTVVVVEHDPELVESADHVIDMGPGAGEYGGLVVAEGSVESLRTHPDSLTGAWLDGRLRMRRDRPDTLAKSWINLRGLSLHNVLNLNCSIPQARLTAICGVSGSGKSTLALDLLVPGVEGARTGRRGHNRKGVTVDDPFSETVVVDQSPLGTTPRSNPASYSHLWDHVRDLYAALPEAKARGWGKLHFSFNGGTGRCTACEGRGFVELEMHFLSDVWVRCEACEGRRFPPETLAVKFRGKSVADILDMRVDQAREFLGFHPKARRILDVLQELGLGYLRLGQPATQLSGGEAQRLRIAGELSRNRRGRALVVLDEPTTGLHSSDVQILLDALSRLVLRGDTVVVIEHHLDVIALADWVLEMGPEGGEGGGNLLWQGPPDSMGAGTPTGVALAARRTAARRSLQGGAVTELIFPTLLEQAEHREEMDPGTGLNGHSEVPHDALIAMGGP